MSHSTNATENNHQKHPKVYFKQYLANLSEPGDDISSDSPAELEAELLESSYLMKRRFRRIAQKIRTYYS
ncbi:MAG TPA: hypothetical protein VMR18_02455 [Candidatus Saccharimonadales bacterium]|jgi:hypothetical protein|nr:hypothetical protein [Candidatus Saccharimonadales bacterium]